MGYLPFIFYNNEDYQQRSVVVTMNVPTSHHIQYTNYGIMHTHTYTKFVLQHVTGNIGRIACITRQIHKLKLITLCKHTIAFMLPYSGCLEKKGMISQKTMIFRIHGE